MTGVPRPRPVARRAALLVALAALLAGPAARAQQKEPPPPSNFRLEATLGGGWRTSIDANDRNPSFEAGGLQLEVAIGPMWGGLSLLGGVRARVGAVAGASDFQSGAGAAPFVSYAEVSANAGLQVALDDKIRVRVGPDAGYLFVLDHRAPVLGGFLAITFDTVSWKDDRIALILVLRADLQAVLTDDVRLPRNSTSFGAGVGVRY